MVLLPDIAAGRAIAEAAMVDTCVVYRDPEGSADDTFNATTGALTPPVGDQTTVYTGPCLLRTENIQARSGDEGGATVSRKLQGARVPVSAPPFLFGDLLVVTAAANDPQLVDRRARVLDVDVNSFAVTRKVSLEDQSGAVVR
jgi:hypothetical protein